MNARTLVLELLLKTEDSKQYSNIALDNALKKSELSPADKGLASALFYGVIERRITLDYQIKSLSSRELAKIDSRTLNALRIGLYQLIYLNRIPHHASINESVSLCPRKSAGFANAILRSFLRKGGLTLPDPANTIEYLSVAYSVDIPLISKLLSVFEKEETERIKRINDQEINRMMNIQNQLKKVIDDRIEKEKKRTS